MFHDRLSLVLDGNGAYLINFYILLSFAVLFYLHKYIYIWAPLKDHDDNSIFLIYLFHIYIKYVHLPIIENVEHVNEPIGLGLGIHVFMVFICKQQKNFEMYLIQDKI